MNYGTKSMTQAGLTMLAQAKTDAKAVIFDSMIVSERVLTTATDVTKLTAADFTNALTYPISSKSNVENSFTVKAVVTNEPKAADPVKQDFKIALVGVTAHIDGSDDSQLISVAVGEDPAVLTAFKDTEYSLTFGVTQIYANASDISFKLGNIAYALASDLDKLRSDVDIIISDKLKDVAKTSVANTFTKQQTLSAGAVDGNGNSYVTAPDAKATAQGLVNAGVTKAASDATVKANGAKATGISAANSAASAAAVDATGKANSAEAGAKTYASSVAAAELVAANKNTDVKTAPLVKTADTANWQKQALFNAGSYNLGSASGDYRTYVEANFSTAGVRYIRLQNNVDKDENGVLIQAMDTQVISEGSGWYYAEGISMNGQMLFRRWNQTSDTGWKRVIDSKSGYGAENLILNSRADTGLEHWGLQGSGTSNSSKFSVGSVTHAFYKNGVGGHVFSIDNANIGSGGSLEVSLGSDRFWVTPGQNVSWSILVAGGANVSSFDVYLMFDDGSSPSMIQGDAVISGQKPNPNAMQLYSGTVTAPDTAKRCFVRVDNNGATPSSDGSLKYTQIIFTEVKVAMESASSPWSQATKDVVHTGGDETIDGTKTFTNPVNALATGLYATQLADGADCDTLTQEGLYQATSGAIVNGPDGVNKWSMIRVHNLNGANGCQELFTTNTGQMFTRAWNYNGGVINWTAWRETTAKADFDSSVFMGKDLTATDDIFTLEPGTYYIHGVMPKNAPALTDGNGNNWGYVKIVQTELGAKFAYFHDVFYHSREATYSGNPATWSTWKIPEQDSLNQKANDSQVFHRNPATGEVVEKLYAPGGITLAGGHVLNVSATDGLTIDGKPLLIKAADEATAKTSSANDKLHYYYTEES
ncbi:pyocin knob domain-containing protein [Levilactobacillus andaensis]|uniref:pyocin knob domain-containing protein n=1 Tax=Levilactobacillus andaensis TaxID=2799570 RepID=UPI001944E2D0|nr:pyocin knob domain-containing protein [Levilactobacillus andaensis]